MIRNLKALGLALVAVFAMSAVAASVAAAQTQGVLTTDGTEVKLTGTDTVAEPDSLLMEPKISRATVIMTSVKKT